MLHRACWRGELHSERHLASGSIHLSQSRALESVICDLNYLVPWVAFPRGNADAHLQVFDETTGNDIHAEVWINDPLELLEYLALVRSGC